MMEMATIIIINSLFRIAARSWIKNVRWALVVSCNQMAAITNTNTIPIPQNLYGALYKQNSAKGA